MCVLALHIYQALFIFHIHTIENFLMISRQYNGEN